MYICIVVLYDYATIFAVVLYEIDFPNQIMRGREGRLKSKRSLVKTTMNRKLGYRRGLPNVSRLPWEKNQTLRNGKFCVNFGNR